MEITPEKLYAMYLTANNLLSDSHFHLIFNHSMLQSWQIVLVGRWFLK